MFSFIFSISRQLNTNQRMTFDIDPWGKFISTGSQDGKVLIYNTSTFELVSSTSSQNDQQDCINSCLFHPYSSILVTSSGQRQFSLDNEDEIDCPTDDSIDKCSAIQLWYLDFESESK